MLWNIAVNDAGAQYDPLTLLRSRTMFGRPDWNAIYGRIKQAIEGGQYLPGSNAQLKTRVGVRLLQIVLTPYSPCLQDLFLRTQCDGSSNQEGNCRPFKR